MRREMNADKGVFALAKQLSDARPDLTVLNLRMFADQRAAADYVNSAEGGRTDAAYGNASGHSASAAYGDRSGRAEGDAVAVGLPAAGTTTASKTYQDTQIHNRERSMPQGHVSERRVEGQDVAMKVRALPYAKGECTGATMSSVLLYDPKCSSLRTLSCSISCERALLPAPAHQACTAVKCCVLI